MVISRSALENLSIIGVVNVNRSASINNCYAWDVTFITNLGPLSSLVVDGLDLTETVVEINVSNKSLDNILHLMVRTMGRILSPI